MTYPANGHRLSTVYPKWRGNNFVGSRNYTGRCSNFTYDVYKSIGFPLGNFQRAAFTGSYPTLIETQTPVRGDIVQYLKADGSQYDHVAIYAGGNNMFTSSSSRKAIILQSFSGFNPYVKPNFYHYVGR